MGAVSEHSSLLNPREPSSEKPHKLYVKKNSPRKERRKNLFISSQLLLDKSLQQGTVSPHTSLAGCMCTWSELESMVSQTSGSSYVINQPGVARAEGLQRVRDSRCRKQESPKETRTCWPPITGCPVGWGQ